MSWDTLLLTLRLTPTQPVHREATIRTMPSARCRTLLLGIQLSTLKMRITDVAYNATNNELVHTKTLVKNYIVLIDSTP